MLYIKRKKEREGEGVSVHVCVRETWVARGCAATSTIARRNRWHSFCFRVFDVLGLGTCTQQQYLSPAMLRPCLRTSGSLLGAR